MPFSRRHLLLSGAAVASASWLLPGVAVAEDTPDRLAELERANGGRLGVHLVDEAGAPSWSYRSDERFAMCSTLKALVTGLVLSRVDAGQLDLAAPVAIRRKDVVANSPVTREHVKGTLTVGELCHATMTTSDNAAVNLLIGLLGGTTEVNAFLRRIGDPVTRLDRLEPEVNVVDLEYGDKRDTTTPAAMAESVRALALGTALSEASREVYVGWLRANTTGGTRLRVGWPTDWSSGDKTGTGPDGPTNDVAVAWPPGRTPFVLAAFYDRTGHAMEENAVILAEVGRLVAAG